MYLKYIPGYIRQRLIKRSGHKPGELDVIEPLRGSPFWARPNFFYLQQCGRPCWLPIFAAPCTTLAGWSNADWAINTGWPCEYYQPHDNNVGPHCYSCTTRDGDRLNVVGQIKGGLCETLTNEIGQRSDVWNVVLIPPRHVHRNHHLLLHTPIGADDQGGYYMAFAPDIWLGNLGWRDMVPVVTHEQVRSIYNQVKQGL